MKCRLCDRPTTAGTGKLCFDCTKSLHRARARSAKVRKTSVSESPSARGEGTAAMGSALALGPMFIPALGWRRLGVLAAACLAAIWVVYFLQPESDRRWALDSLVVDEVPSSFAGRSNARAPGPSVNREGPASAVQAQPAEIPSTVSAVQARPELNAAKMSAPSAGGRASLRPGTASAGAPLDSKQPAPAADGAQALASAMEKCEKEAFLSRFICEQKTYMQYCADKWEKDPRCMRRTASN